MAVTHGIRKFYSSFRGLNEILDDVVREAGFATVAENVRILEDGALSKRRGYKIFAESEGGYGVIGFDRIDPETGMITQEILVLSETLRRMRTATITLTNVNSDGQDINVSIQGDSTADVAASGWGSSPWGAFAWGDAAGRGFTLTLGVAAVIDNNGDTVTDEKTTVAYLGDEIESPGLTIASLVTFLNSGTDVTASATVDTATPAPFLRLLDGLTIEPGEVIELVYYYTEDITADSAAGFPLGFADFKTNDQARHVDYAIFNRSVYITTGLDKLQQYDGQALFQAGMKKGTIPTTATGGAGLPVGDYLYKVQPVFRDRNGAFHEGAISDPSISLTAASEEIDVVVTNIEDGNGYDSRGGLAQGAQTLSPVSGVVTISLDDGSGGAHTVVSGDKVRVLNRDVATNAYAEYVVVTTTTNSIDVASSVDIDLNDNDIVSTGITLDVYRTIAGGTTEYLLVESLNNNPFATTQTFTDNTADSALGARFLEPLAPPAEPPTCRYITTFNNSLVLGYQKTDPNKVFYSEPDDPTNFPVLNNFLTESNDGGTITAVTQSNETLVVFRKRSIFLVTGDFARDSIRVTNLSSGGIGCSSHSSVQDINGVIFFLGERGVYTMAGAGIPTLISNQVIKSLTTKRTLEAERLHFDRAVAVHHIQDKQYLLYIPAESVDSGNIYSNESSLLLAYDYVKDDWTTWKNTHFSSGVTYQGDDLWFSSRELRVADSQVEYRVWKQHNDNRLHDYGDQLDPVEFTYGSSWEAVGNPSVAKKFLRVKLHSYTDVDSPLPVSAFNVDASTEIDYKENTPHSQFSFNFPDRGSTWDSRPWDEFTWGGAQQPTFKTKLRKGQARSMRLILENSQYDTNVIFTGWEVEYAAPQGNTIKR